jgi:shikimate kinase
MFEIMGRCPIWLVGMMGAGKSAVGPLLAERASAYETAVIAVDTERRTLEAVAEEILRRLDAARLGRESDVERGVHL